MKIKLKSFALLLILSLACFGQESNIWDKWSWLMGGWKGEGSGEPGKGGGTFSFAFDLDKNIIVRKSHSEYPATANKPEIKHDDLMIIYIGNDIEPKAIYFDNEHHVINYSINYGDNSIIFTSDKIEKSPIFRLTYNLLDDDLINTKFEMSMDGKNFMTYIEGKSTKIK